MLGPVGIYFLFAQFKRFGMQDLDDDLPPVSLIVLTFVRAHLFNGNVN